MRNFVTPFENLMVQAASKATSTTPQIVTDTIRLANDFGTWIILGSASIAGVLLAFFGFKWYVADENEKKPHSKRIKGILIGSVLVLTAESVVKLVLSYYTH